MKNKLHITRIVACNIIRLIISWTYYFTTGLLIGAKRQKRNIQAMLKGYNSYADMIQIYLNHNQAIYEREKGIVDYHSADKIQRWEKLMLK